MKPTNIRSESIANNELIPPTLNQKNTLDFVPKKNESQPSFSKVYNILDELPYVKYISFYYLRFFTSFEQDFY